MFKLIVAISIFLLATVHLCNKKPSKPNIILIMADDLGYEGLSVNGCVNWDTPTLDSLAQNGLSFTNCFSQPKCTPSRVKILSGQYNIRNYKGFGYLDTNIYTIGNLAKDSGYRTCVVGKWQLNGSSTGAIIRDDYQDRNRPIHFGFDEFCLWQLTKKREEGERYSNPLLETNHGIIQADEDDYGPALFLDYIKNFLEEKSNKPFFLYYPMALPHSPFEPTPKTKSWQVDSLRSEDNIVNFPSMVRYIDDQVKGILEILEINNLSNTVIIFTSDNGTDPRIRTMTKNGSLRGGKGRMANAGTHVPLIVYWDNVITTGNSVDYLVDFTDIFPTIQDLVRKQPKFKSDGKSLRPLMVGEAYNEKKNIFISYKDRIYKDSDHEGSFCRNKRFKLYNDGRFFDLKLDVLERHPILKKSKHSDIRKELAECLSTRQAIIEEQ